VLEGHGPRSQAIFILEGDPVRRVVIPLHDLTKGILLQRTLNPDLYLFPRQAFSIKIG